MECHFGRLGSCLKMTPEFYHAGTIFRQLLFLARKYFVFYGKRIKFAFRFGKYKK